MTKNENYLNENNEMTILVATPRNERVKEVSEKLTKLLSSDEDQPQNYSVSYNTTPGGGQVWATRKNNYDMSEEEFENFLHQDIMNRMSFGL
jgi:hypothetical protein